VQNSVLAKIINRYTDMVLFKAKKYISLYGRTIAQAVRRWFLAVETGFSPGWLEVIFVVDEVAVEKVFSSVTAPVGAR
jgi:hypothetical protein